MSLFLSPILDVSGPYEGQEPAICSNWIHTRNESVKFQKRFLKRGLNFFCNFVRKVRNLPRVVLVFAGDLFLALIC
ncbi:non-ribosomal peptide synthetase [Pseudomonas monteilii]|uniref:Non-ribosomal peptide synthetase n=1 Tax=Pseudomonas monteilii TaxID=76759 RepID=A0AAE6R7X7_9PSED|nr:non-ribosomal peptide synthetase [Pseudomonas monteilii]